MDKEPFIITHDKATAEQLKEIGLELISENMGEFVFLNSQTVPTPILNKNEVIETNKLIL